MEKIKFFNKLSIKTMLIIALAFIIMTAFVTAVESYFIKIKTFNEYKNIAEAILIEPLNAIDDWAGDIMGVGHFIAQSSIIKDTLVNPTDKNSIESAKQLLLNILKDYPSYEDICTVYLKKDNSLVSYGSKVACANESETTESQPEVLNVINEILKGKPYYIGITYKDKSTGRVILPIGLPVNVDNSILGVVLIQVKPVRCTPKSRLKLALLKVY